MESSKSPTMPVDRWQIRSALLKLNNSEILLCDRTVGGQREFSVIQRFHAASPYAQANGNAEVLLAGRDPVFLVQAYAEGAQHTLGAMANNLVAKAHRTVWERFANTSPVRVIRAISEKCAQAASLNHDAEQEQSISQPRPAAPSPSTPDFLFRFKTASAGCEFVSRNTFRVFLYCFSILLAFFTANHHQSWQKPNTA